MYRCVYGVYWGFCKVFVEVGRRVWGSIVDYLLFVSVIVCAITGVFVRFKMLYILVVCMRVTRLVIL